MIKRVTVNRNVAASNRKHGRNEPTLSVQTSKGVTKCYEVVFRGPSTLIQKAPESKGLKCGATIWIETNDPILVRTDPLMDSEFHNPFLWDSGISNRRSSNE